MAKAQDLNFEAQDWNTQNTRKYEKVFKRKHVENKCANNWPIGKFSRGKNYFF